MTLYAKKKIPVEAQQFASDGKHGWTALYRFANGLVRRDDMDPYPPDPGTGQSVKFYVFDFLHNTWVEFKRGDWIIKGIRGEFYPVEEAVFAETYEEYFEDRDSPV
ncbi:hypothetical protein SEA_A3WALLY_215 [Microbacterium phage A3Wally]|nr:hypothetical protein SEA_A3WALLY_215 [Microbacterium phage A3Wally]